METKECRTFWRNPEASKQVNCEKRSTIAMWHRKKQNRNKVHCFRITAAIISWRSLAQWGGLRKSLFWKLVCTGHSTWWSSVPLCHGDAAGRPGGLQGCLRAPMGAALLCWAAWRQLVGLWQFLAAYVKGIRRKGFLFHTVLSSHFLWQS